MKKNGSRLFILMTISFLSLRAMAGSEGRGGGDICEDRIKIVRDDIKNWIIRGRAIALKLPKNLSTAQYKEKMLTQIERAKVKCVGQGDAGYPVEVSGTPKVCRFDKKNDLSQITCDFNKFQKMTASDQYVLIHHEYAGLAEVEQPDDDSSNYEISNQIEVYFGNQTTTQAPKSICTIDRVTTGRYVLYVDSKPVRAFDGTEDGYLQALENARKLEKANVCILIE